MFKCVSMWLWWLCVYSMWFCSLYTSIYVFCTCNQQRNSIPIPQNPSLTPNKKETPNNSTQAKSRTTISASFNKSRMKVNLEEGIKMAAVSGYIKHHRLKILVFDQQCFDESNVFSYEIPWPLQVTWTLKVFFHVNKFSSYKHRTLHFCFGWW